MNGRGAFVALMAIFLGGCPGRPAPPRGMPTAAVTADAAAGQARAGLVRTMDVCTAEDANAAEPPAPTACVVEGTSEHVLRNMLVRTKEGETFAVHARGARLRVFVREVDHDLRVEVTGPIAFVATLAHPPTLRTKRALEFGGVAKVRAGTMAVGATAQGTRMAARLSLAEGVSTELLPLDCNDVRLATSKEHLEGPMAFDVFTKNPVDEVRFIERPLVVVPTPDAREGLRIARTEGLSARKIGATSSHLRIRARTERGTELTGWVPRSAVDDDPALLGIGGGCGCGSSGRSPVSVVDVAAGTPIHAKPGGTPWAVARERVRATSGSAENGWIQLTSIAGVSQGDCFVTVMDDGMDNAWVRADRVTQVEP